MKTFLKITMVISNRNTAASFVIGDKQRYIS